MPRDGQFQYVVSQVVPDPNRKGDYITEEAGFKSRPKAFEYARSRCHEHPAGSGPLVTSYKYRTAKYLGNPNWHAQFTWKFDIEHPNRDPFKSEVI